MPWQELTGHVNGRKVWVRSRGGDDYVAETDTDRLNKNIYSQLVNSAHDEKQYWAWVDFEDGDPIVKDFSRGGRPSKPPWEYP